MEAKLKEEKIKSVIQGLTIKICSMDLSCYSN